MARYRGAVGYGTAVETPPDSGVFVDTIVERTYVGDVIRNTRMLEGEKVNPDIDISNSISIIVDKYAVDNFMKIKYLRWAGALWVVTSVERKESRLILSIGGVYNGPTP